MKHFFLLLALSLAFTAFSRSLLDIPYYDDDFPKQGNLEYLAERCKLDVYLPDGDIKDFPVLVWYHSGGLTGGNKHIPPCLDMTKIALVAVNYRFSGPRAQCPDYIYDAAASLAWVFRHIAEYGANPHRIYVSGHSAGGYLTAMISMDAKYLGAFGASPKQIRAALPISGQMSTHFQILNERKEKDPATPEFVIDEYAPIFLAHAEVPPMTLIAGDSDLEFAARPEENALLAARLRYSFRRWDVKYVQLPTFTHANVLVPGMAVVNNYILNDKK